MNNQEPILRIKNLTKYFNVSNSWFGKPVLLHAVEDMSFDILKGHTVGIVGESGSGKSTLARLILKLIPATSGEILYDGMDLLKTRDDSVLRRDLQMIFQDPYASLDPRIKIGDSIAEPLREHKMCKSRKELNERVVEMLERVGLQKRRRGFRTSSPVASASASTSPVLSSHGPRLSFVTRRSARWMYLCRHRC